MNEQRQLFELGSELTPQAARCGSLCQSLTTCPLPAPPPSPGPQLPADRMSTAAATPATGGGHSLRPGSWLLGRGAALGQAPRHPPGRGHSGLGLARGPLRTGGSWGHETVGATLVKADTSPFPVLCPQSGGAQPSKLFEPPNLWGCFNDADVLPWSQRGTEVAGTEGSLGWGQREGGGSCHPTPLRQPAKVRPERWAAQDPVPIPLILPLPLHVSPELVKSN